MYSFTLRVFIYNLEKKKLPLITHTDMHESKQMRYLLMPVL